MTALAETASPLWLEAPRLPPVALDGWNDEILEEIVDVLDQAAQRIERAKKARRE